MNLKLNDKMNASNKLTIINQIGQDYPLCKFNSCNP